MTRFAAVLGLILAFAVAALLAPPASSQQATAPKATLKVGKGEKVCRVKLKYTGEIKTWVCKKEEPCCVWHEISYVKCGSTITGCL
jgi:hypothetical protein